MTKLIHRLEAARLLGVHPQTLDKLRHSGQIAYIQLGRKICFEEQAIEGMLSKLRVSKPETSDRTELE
jgi:excisionase family DNA binding protein